MEQAVSYSPEGRAYPLPRKEDYAKEFQRLEEAVREQRALGRQIVVVMGLGFVGAVMAAVVADSTDRKTGRAMKYVIGMQRPSARSFWKIPMLNSGVSPSRQRTRRWISSSGAVCWNGETSPPPTPTMP